MAMSNKETMGLGAAVFASALIIASGPFGLSFAMAFAYSALFSAVFTSLAYAISASPTTSSPRVVKTVSGSSEPDVIIIPSAPTHTRTFMPARTPHVVSRTKTFVPGGVAKPASHPVSHTKTFVPASTAPSGPSHSRTFIPAHNNARAATGVSIKPAVNLSGATHVSRTFIPKNR